MDDKYFAGLIEDMIPGDIDNNFFREVAEQYGVKMASELLLLFENVYPDAKEGQRKISVPLKSTFIFRVNKRKIDGVKI